MVSLKNREQIENMRRAGRVVAEALLAMRDAIVPGVTSTLDLDQVAADVLAKRGAVSAFKGYQPPFSDVAYEYSTCISVNEEVVHGVPSVTRILKEGDIVSLDFGASVEGWYADAALTVPVGEISSAAKNLLLVTRESLYKGIAEAKAGAPIGNISNAVQRHAERSRYGVIRSLVGHGIGRRPHEEPQVPNYGRAGKGLVLKPGMTICIEPMVNIGSPEANHVPGDDWTIVSGDKSLSAHFEHTIAITEEGPELLTDLAPMEK